MVKFHVRFQQNGYYTNRQETQLQEKEWYKNDAEWKDYEKPDWNQPITANHHATQGVNLITSIQKVAILISGDYMARQTILP